MGNEFKVFFSWQSDLSAYKTKRFIEEAITVAKKQLEGIIEVVPDEATRERLGSPDITHTIFEKIDQCNLFIADVSVVGSYTKDKDEGNRFFPNPNVLLELGYAAGVLTWERCICLANTEFGSLDQLPFDLNHRRITAYSFEDGDKKNEVKRIARIIKSTIEALNTKPLKRKGFAFHMLGTYDLESNSFSPRIIPYNSVLSSEFITNTKEKGKEVLSLIPPIEKIHLNTISEELYNRYEMAKKTMCLKDLLDDPDLSRVYKTKQKGASLVKTDAAFIKKVVKDCLDIELTDDFFCMGSLVEFSASWLGGFLPGKTVLEGSEEEKNKYELYQEFESKIYEYWVRNTFIHTFDDVVLVPLAIHNSSFVNDERLSITVRIEKGTAVVPDASFICEELQGSEGLVFDLGIIEEYMNLPDNSNIHFDNSVSLENLAHQRYIAPTPPLTMPLFNNEPKSDENDYEDELRKYFKTPLENENNTFLFDIGQIRPQETLWLDKILIVRPDHGEIDIEYSIKSKNTTGEISSKIQL